MAGRTVVPAKPTAVVAQAVSADDLMAMLKEGGFLGSPNSQEYHRLTLKGGKLIAGNTQDPDEIYPPDKTGKCMTARIAKPPVYYNAFFLSEKNENNDKNTFNAADIGMPELNGRFSKHYDDPTEAALDDSAANAAYDHVARATGRKGAFKADIWLQIVPESGELTGDEDVYTLSLSTTSALDFRGTSKNPSAGVVQPKNFILQLAEFARDAAIERGASDLEQKTAALKAMASLNMGDVIADVYVLDASNEEGTFNWTIVGFKPVYIAESEEQQALEAGDDLSTNTEDVKF